MNNAIDVVVNNEEGNGVERRNGHKPQYLFIEVPIIAPNKQNGKRGGTAPVRCCRDQTAT